VTVAKPEKKSAEASPEASAGKSKTGLIIGAVVVAVVAAGIFYLRSGPSQPNPNAPKTNPDIAELMKQGPLPDIALGSADAPNTIIEYASMTCPHCARFHNDIYPKLKEKDIDTGKVKFIFREFPLDGLAVAASMLARCAGPDRFYPMIDGLFETQSTWAVPGEDGKKKLELIAKQAGFSKESFEKCLADKDLFNKIVKERQRANKEFGVDSTPTFFINGKRLTGEHELKDFEAMFKGASPDGTPPPSG
jgi:protein-disulfide isomerase